jgi:hypothetical protein
MKKLFLLFFLFLGAFVSCRYVQDAKDTTFDQFKASELLRKYEYFKDVSANLDKKIADIQVYESRVTNMTKEYEGTKRINWAKEDREQMSVWQSEVAGVKASYNSLAAEYNSAMSKFNYSFCNIGTLPKGATTVLPKEYKPYITE